MTTKLDFDNSLYGINKAVWDKIAIDGAAPVAEVAKHFTLCADMDRALGYENAAARWHSGRGVPSGDAIRRAAAWLRSHKNAARQEPMADAVGELLLVACPPGMAEKAKRVLAVIGCDVTEI